jgi:hypothetical protein
MNSLLCSNCQIAIDSVESSDLSHALSMALVNDIKSPHHHAIVPPIANTENIDRIGALMTRLGYWLASHSMTSFQGCPAFLKGAVRHSPVAGVTERNQSCHNCFQTLTPGSGGHDCLGLSFDVSSRICYYCSLPLDTICQVKLHSGSVQKNMPESCNSGGAGIIIPLCFYLFSLDKNNHFRMDVYDDMGLDHDLSLEKYVEWLSSKRLDGIPLPNTLFVFDSICRKRESRIQRQSTENGDNESNGNRKRSVDEVYRSE